MQDLLCFSHLDWNFVYQRPQHLLSRFAKNYKIYYFEEPKEADRDWLESETNGQINIIKTFVRDRKNYSLIQKMVNDFIKKNQITPSVLWYYTPMAMNFTGDLEAKVVVFDSMDELSAFRFAPPELLEREAELLRKADIVFTGGNSLYKAKKHRHHNIYSFPSSIEKEHFAKARKEGQDPEDQRHIDFPRLGFYGVLDERFNTDLLCEAAAKRPDWNFIIIGPVVKIAFEDLPKADNIFYLQSKSYSELPEYIRHWDIAMNMFALNEATRFISPTKTPEYLSAGLPVISTSIEDVVKPYGEMNLVEIADDAEVFVQKAEKLLNGFDRSTWLQNVDDFLADKSWDNTHREMQALINNLN